MKRLINYYTELEILIKRSLLRYVRVPQLLLFSSIQPVMFLLLFTFIFGGVVSGDSQSYINYLLPGILIQIVAFGSLQTSVGLAEDLKLGITDRMKSLPISRSSVIASKTIADMTRNLLVIMILFGVATLLGYTLHQGIFYAILALLLALSFGFTISWMFVISAIYAKNAEIANSLGFILIFPLIFVSSAFVPINTLPIWLQGFATYQPISVVISAIRSLTLSGPDIFILYSILWIVTLLMIFIPLATYMYRKMEY